MVGKSEIRKSIERATRTGQQDLFQGSSAHRISRLVSPGGAAAARSASPRTPGLTSRGTATLDTDAIAAAMAGTVQPETSSKKLPARNFGSGSSYRSTPSYSRSPRHTATEKPKKRATTKWSELTFGAGGCEERIYGWVSSLSEDGTRFNEKIRRTAMLLHKPRYVLKFYRKVEMHAVVHSGGGR